MTSVKTRSGLIATRWLWMLAVLTLHAVSAPAGVAQTCGPQWLPFDVSTSSVPGVALGFSTVDAVRRDSTVAATTLWDPDGSGPQTPQLVVAGFFDAAGAAPVRDIALYDPVTGVWSAFPGDPTGLFSINALAVLPNGDLVAGGRLGVVRWTGSTWERLGSLSGGTASALVVMPNGDLVAGGVFSFNAGDRVVKNIARWDGTAWMPLELGLSSSVEALALLPNGDLVAGGTFLSTGERRLRGIARWNGNAWSAFAPEGADGPNLVYALAVLSNGDLVAAGDRFGSTVWRWVGDRWVRLGSPLLSDSFAVVSSLRALPNGQLVLVVRSESSSINEVHLWDGSTWVLLGVGNDLGPRFALGPLASVTVLPDGDLVVGLRSSRIAISRTFRAPSVVVSRIARWNGSSWSAIGTGMDEAVRAIAVMPNGDLLVGGRFDRAGPIVDALRIARWSEGAWSRVGAGFGFGSIVEVNSTRVRDIHVLPSGQIVASGNLVISGDSPPLGLVAKWDGEAWSRVGSGVFGVSASTDFDDSFMTRLPGGDLVIASRFVSAGGTPALNIARWNGTTWSQVGPGSSIPPRVLATLANGDLVASPVGVGTADLGVARWDGTFWQPLGSGPSVPLSFLLPLPNGDLIAGGRFASIGGVAANNIARWNGTTWSALGSGTNDTATAAIVLPNGDLIVFGTFTTAGGNQARSIARWNGDAWSGFGDLPSVQTIGTAVLLPSGEIVVGGGFARIGNLVTSSIARFSFTGAPSVSADPRPQSLLVDSTASLSAAPNDFFSNVFFRWQREIAPDIYVDLLNGAGGSDGVASGSGGSVVGASGQFASPTRVSSTTLTIENATTADTGRYRVVFWNSCGEVASRTVDVKVKATAADFNGDGVVDDADFALFTVQYNALLCSDPSMPDGCSADLNSDGQVDNEDFVLFVRSYVTMIF